MSTERTRFTIAVEPEVYEAFAALAHSSGVSLSRCIGDWLRDTAEAAQMTTIRVNEVRKSPQDAFQAFMRDAIVPETLRVMRRMEDGTLYRAGSGGGVAAEPPPSAGVLRVPPRPVIRGGKSPQQGKRLKGGRS